MKLNWGQKLFLSMTVFIVFIVSLGVFMSMNNDSIEEKQYYEKGQHYNKQIEMERNTESLSARPSFVIDKTKHLHIMMPDSTIVNKASLLLYKPDDSSKDQQMDVSDLLKSQRIKKDISACGKGKWTIKFNWTTGQKEYYIEQDIFIP